MDQFNFIFFWPFSGLLVQQMVLGSAVWFLARLGRWESSQLDLLAWSVITFGWFITWYLYYSVILSLLCFISHVSLNMGIPSVIIWDSGLDCKYSEKDCIIYSKVKSNFPFMENFLTFDLSWPTLLFFFRHECKKKVLCLPRCSKTSTWIEHIKERAAEQFSESFLTHFLLKDWKKRTLSISVNLTAFDIQMSMCSVLLHYYRPFCNLSYL